MSWKDHYVVFDTETTGFGPEAKIVEIALVEFRSGLKGATSIFSTLVNPGEIDWNHKDVLKALEINGLSKEALADAPLFEDIVIEVFRMLSCPTWVAHNIKFDKRMIVNEVSRLPDHLMVTKFCPPIAMIDVDTMLCDLGLNPGKKSRKLVDVAKRWKVDFSGAHRAVDDTMACARVLQKMMPLLTPVDEEFMKSHDVWAEKWHKLKGY